MNSPLSRLSASVRTLPLWSLLLLYVLVWVVAQLVSHTNFDPYGDMLENYIWGQSFAWGNLKHPPLVGWITGLWFEVMPRTQAFYHLLAYLNSGLGILGVYALAKAVGLGSSSRAAALLLILALPYSTLAGKFNANAILLSTWPWIAALWFQAMSAPRTRAWWLGLLFGLVAGLGLLGKYYTGVLLLSLGLCTLFTAQGRTWLATPSPWLALGVFVLVLLPHGHWLMENNFASLAYVQAQGTGGVDWHQWLKFLAVPFGFWLLAYLAALLIMPGWRLRSVWEVWQPRGPSDVLFWIILLPYVMTLAFGASGFVNLSSPWAMPLGFALTVFWLRNMTEATTTEHIEQLNHRAQNLFFSFLILVLCLSPIYAWQQGKNGQANYYLPVEEAVQQLELQWYERHSAGYDWVAGDYQDAAAVAFYGTQAHYLFNAPGNPTTSGVIFCHMGEVSAAKSATLCTQRADRWGRERTEQMTTIEFTAEKTGPRFPLQITHLYRVYFYAH